MNILLRSAKQSAFFPWNAVSKLCSHPSMLISRSTFAGTSKTAISAKALPAPVAAFSHGIKSNGFIYLSGQVGISPATKTLVNDKLEDQTKQALQNIKTILTDAGSRVDNIVKTTVLLADIKDFKAVNDIYAQFFKENSSPQSPLPARACYAVKDLPLGAKVEIEAIAF
ncbi:hypothetical protein RFI_13258 [Reticulomyxa filosa]|uniref:Uncharacterized protein n=1 Tax=Reticulomyxa filosa TaxID=46433 RepID=X6NC84_RETFI|nr:hypothetical protein RFI_13258 [Reticulomyxa filosa]|eukprot:ETO23900.1 hypothetical protein RFI_13258 [Reticulomyxa filosa]